MLTKESLGSLLTKLVRIIPGMPSYRDRESLRAQDKALREALCQRMLEASEFLWEAVSDMLSKSGLTHLDKVDLSRRKLLRLSDTLKFSPYGYSSVFAQEKVDEAKLAKVYEYDLSLAETVSQLEAKIKELKDKAAEGFSETLLKGLNETLALLEKKIAGRDALLKG